METQTEQGRSRDVEASRARTGYIAGLRELADRLEANPACPLPWTGASRYGRLTIFAHNLDEFRAAARTIKGRKRNNDGTLSLDNEIDGLYVTVSLLGEQVCEKVQVGTEKATVQRTVREAEVEEWEVERAVYEWKCPPILVDDELGVPA